MTRLLALLALGAVACATPRQGAKPAGPPVALTRESARATVTRTATLAPMSCRLPDLGPMPVAPAIDWVAEGCPPSFMACFSGPDAERLQRYLTAIQQWARDARKRYSDGR